MKDQQPSRTLTEAELELMTIVWRHDGATVNEVLAALPRSLAYTSVSTILRILVQKGFLIAEPEGRTHRYRPRVSKEAYEKAALAHVVRDVFDGNPRGLVRCLVDSGALSPEDCNELLDLINKKGKPT